MEFEKLKKIIADTLNTDGEAITMARYINHFHTAISKQVIGFINRPFIIIPIKTCKFTTFPPFTLITDSIYNQILLATVPSYQILH